MSPSTLYHSCITETKPLIGFHKADMVIR